MEVLLAELKAATDEESYDDEAERLLNVEKALEADQIKDRMKTLKNDIELKTKENEQNISRI